MYVQCTCKYWWWLCVTCISFPPSLLPSLPSLPPSLPPSLFTLHTLPSIPQLEENKLEDLLKEVAENPPPPDAPPPPEGDDEEPTLEGDDDILLPSERSGEGGESTHANVALISSLHKNA